jgi:hypothetical protein
MLICPAQLRKRVQLVVLAVISLAMPLVRAAEATITSVSFAGGSYVIDSDATNGAAGYDRDSIPLSVVVGLTGTPISEPIRDFRIRFRMFDDEGTEVPLAAGSQYSGVIRWPSAFGAVTPFGGGQPLPASVTFTGSPKPLTRLDSERTYRFEAQVQRWNLSIPVSSFLNLGDARFSPFRRFYHFINTASNDPARNVIARMGGNPTFSQRFAISSSPNQSSFLLSVPYQLRRYDNYASGSAIDPTPVQLVWNVKLYREAGAVDPEIPLMDDTSFETPVVVPFYSAGTTPREPVLVSSNTILRLRPMVQLDSREDYYVRVTISHRELAAPAAPVIANTTSSTTQRLLHFNGRLDFGAVQTSIVEILGEPAAGSSLQAGSPPPAVLCSPQVNIGRLAAPNNNHTFGGGAALPVRLLPDGRAIYNDATTFVLVNAPTSPDKDRENGIGFVRSTVRLSTGGAAATVSILTPSGMTVTPTSDSKIGIPLLSVGNQSLSSSLRPVAATLTFAPGNAFYVAEETKPVQIEVNSLTWNRAEGRIDLHTTGTATYIQAVEMSKLAAAPVPAEQKIKRSNERYYAGVSGLLSPSASVRAVGGNSGAHLTAVFRFGAVDFRTHFPHDARIVSSGGRLAISDDAILSTPSNSWLEGVSSISLQYQQACLQQGCVGAAPRFGNFRLKPDLQRLHFTADGGLIAPGEFDTTYAPNERTNLLEWGFIGESAGTPRFAHAVLGRFGKGAFHATGHFLRSNASSLSQDERPGVVHDSGFLASNPTAAPERPGTASHAVGNSDYAGINLRVATQATTVSARSIIANTTTPAYPLKIRSKYYVRRSGNAGIHDAQSTPGDFVLYGFPIRFANFSFGFRETQNVSSATLGEIAVPYPSEFVQPFEELLLSCLGDIKEAKIPEDGEAQSLAYWAAEFQPYTFEFEKEDGCSPGGSAILAMMIQTHAHHISAPLEGKVGWYSDGNIVPPADPAFSVTSRFPLPTRLDLAGPGGEAYSTTTVGEAYFNHYKELPSSDPDGFVSFAARMAVPYFEDLEVQIHTFAKPLESPVGALPSRLHLMGGWKAGGESFFSTSEFDTSHRAYPPGLNILTYRNDGANRLPDPGPDPSADPFSQYRVYARRGFLNESEFFQYPIEFLSGPRVWTSSAPQTNDILIFNVAHQLDRMSPVHADITFGVSHAGLPSLSLANSAYSFIDEAVAGNPAAGGFRTIVAGVLGEPRMDQLNQGVAALGQVTGDRFDLFADHFIANAVNPRLNTAFQALRVAYNAGGTWPADAGAALTVFELEIEGRLESATLSANPATISGPNLTLLNATRAKLTTALDQAIAAMDVLATDTGGQGLFVATNNHGVTRQLVKNLVQQGSPEAGAIVSQLAGPLLDTKIAALVERGAPTLDDVRAALTEVRTRLAELRSQVNGSGEFSQALRKVIQDASAETTDVAIQAAAEMKQIATQEPNRYFNQLPQSAFEDRVPTTDIAVARPHAPISL